MYMLNYKYLVEADIPQAMYENKIDDMLREFEYRLSMQGLDLETYIQYTGLTTDSFREQYADEAEKRVKVRMALEKIAEIENIEVSDEELQAEYDKLSENHNMSVDAIKGIIKEKDLRKDLQVGKAMDLVKENANIK